MILELTFRVAKPLPVVFRCLSEPAQYVAVHPIIARMDPTGSDSYLIEEHLPVGPFTWKFRYPVTLQSNASAGSVDMHAVVMNITRIHLHFQLLWENGVTVVKETITTESKLPVNFILVPSFRKYHQQMFDKISNS